MDSKNQVKPNPPVDGFLVIIVCLVVSNFVLWIVGKDKSWSSYDNIVVSLMLLFNHINSHYVKSGWFSFIRWAWLVLGGLYILSLFYQTFLVN
jgi:general stress protein CsbA